MNKTYSRKNPIFILLSFQFSILFTVIIANYRSSHYFLLLLYTYIHLIVLKLYEIDNPTIFLYTHIALIVLIEITFRFSRNQRSESLRQVYSALGHML